MAKILKILYVAAEIKPFLNHSYVSDIVRKLPQAMQEKGIEIRILVPKFGCINERTNRLHEVVRLSGMNIPVGDDEKPLIIKVASIPAAKLQVYFIDNEDYFKRKATFSDEKGNFFSDNDERAIFFAKGVIETVKKLNWSPDIIHVHGWLASFLPLYLKKHYDKEPLFENSKIVTSVYNQGFKGQLDAKVTDKIMFDGIEKEHIQELEEPDYINMMKIAIKNSDAIIFGSEELPEELTNYLKELEIPMLKYHKKEEFSSAYLDFYLNEVLS
jgi:starch synthase